MPAKPRLPSSLRIGHATYTVKNDPKLCESDDANGITEPDNRVVYLRGDRPADKIREALLHEVLHCCLDTGAARLPHRQEERIVDHLTGPLLSALRDNPELRDYLLA